MDRIQVPGRLMEPADSSAGRPRAGYLHTVLRYQAYLHYA
jgi:hypothetical protein